jgi:hypothetical protein
MSFGLVNAKKEMELNRFEWRKVKDQRTGKQHEKLKLVSRRIARPMRPEKYLRKKIQREEEDSGAEMVDEEVTSPVLCAILKLTKEIPDPKKRKKLREALFETDMKYEFDLQAILKQ